MYGGASGGDEIESSCVRSLLHNELGWFDISPKSRHDHEIRWQRITKDTKFSIFGITAFPSVFNDLAVAWRTITLAALLG